MSSMIKHVENTLARRRYSRLHALTVKDKTGILQTD
jgi:hypothetical protein